MSGYIKGLGHFGLSVSDLEASIGFYSRVLGLDLIERRERDAFFRVGEGDVLALIQYPGGKERFDAEIRPRNKGKAFTHFGLMAGAESAVFDFQTYLESRGVEIVKPAYSRWDGASLYFLDPDGYTLEFIYYAPPEEGQGIEAR